MSDRASSDRWRTTFRPNACTSQQSHPSMRSWTCHSHSVDENTLLARPQNRVSSHAEQIQRLISRSKQITATCTTLYQQTEWVNISGKYSFTFSRPSFHWTLLFVNFCTHLRLSVNFQNFLFVLIYFFLLTWCSAHAEDINLMLVSI